MGRQGVRRRVIGAVWAMTVGAFGCVDDREVSIGAGDAVALDVCTGARTRCVAQEATPMPAITELRQCTGELTGTLVPVFEIDLQAKLCMRGPEAQQVCSVTWASSAVGPDGSLWVLALYEYSLMEGGSPWEVWLGHYTQEGRELGARTIVSLPSFGRSSTDATASVVSLPNGNATVLVHSRTDGTRGLEQRTWLETYRGNLLPDRNGSLLEIGAADLVSTAQGTLIVAGDPLGGGKHGILAALGDGQVLWSQTKVPSAGARDTWGVTSVAVDGAGSARVMSIRAIDRARGKESYGLARFDADGNLVWDRIVAVGDGGIHTPIAVDAMGNTSILVTERDGGAVASTVISVGADGAPRFAYSLGFVPYPGLAVGHDSGRIYVDGSQGEVHEIAADGTTCRTYSLPTEPRRWIQPTIVSGDSLYTASARYRLVPNQ